MKSYETKDIRNVAIVGHSGEGKTSLCEAILYNAKATDRMGSTPAGNTVMDYDEQEIARQISISMGAAYVEWQDVKINLLDVPGFFDFEGELVQAMAAADAAVVVSGPYGEVSVGCEQAIDYCMRNNVPMLLFINQMDKENANYFATVDAFRNAYPNKIAPIQIPIMEGSKMCGYINALKEKAYRFTDKGPQEIPIPEEMKEGLDQVRANLTETAAENDDDLLEKFFNGEELTHEEVVKGIKKGISAGSAIPVLAGSATGNRGIFNLMNEIAMYLPSPLESAPVIATDEAGEPVEVAYGEGKLAARVFKTIADPFVGRMNLVKVIRGSLKNGMTVANTTKDSTEKINSVMIIRGKKQTQVDELVAGDIGALAKLNATNTGDTLCDPSEKVIFEQIKFPKPVISLAVKAVKQGDEDKVIQGFYRLADEDPTFNIEKNAETKDTLISGMGETHLDIMCKKLKAKFNVEAAIFNPRIAFREAIRKTVEAEGKHKKQSGGHGQYGHCKVRFEPTFNDEFEFAEEVVGGSVPKNFIPAVEKGLRECIVKGVLAGYPVVRLKAVLYDGSYHDVDSSEMAFKIAASLAYKEGLKNASPTLLEPIYSVKITVPESYMGDILGDMNKRRGRILGMDLVDGKQVINAEVPYSEMFKYATDLRSMTQGRGKFEMAFERYEEAPKPVVDKVVAAAAKENAE